MNHLQPVFLLHRVAVRQSMTIFWSIVIGIYVLMLISLTLLSDGEVSAIGGGATSIYIFMLIIGVITMNETFPLAIALGATRRHYFAGTQLFFVGLSFVQAGLLAVLSLFEQFYQDQIAKFQMNHFHLHGADNIGQEFVFNFVLLLFMLTLFNTLGTFGYRIGHMFWYGLSAAVIILITLAGLLDWIVPMVKWISRIDSYWTVVVYLIPLIVLFVLINWLCIRRATIRK